MPARTEKEKMLAGESYNCLDPDLEVERQKAKALLRLYNLAAAAPERQSMLPEVTSKPQFLFKCARWSYQRDNAAARLRSTAVVLRRRRRRLLTGWR